MYICNDCFEVYSDLIEGLKKPDSDIISCPLAGCGGNVKQMDEQHYPIYKLLNQKGYKTEFFNMGHPWQKFARSYILFNKCFKDTDFESIPEGFDRLCQNGCVGFEKLYEEGLTENELYVHISESAIKLLKWAESLEELEC